MIDKLSSKKYKTVLNEKGFKNTPTRQAILDIFSKNDKPISADYIYKKLKGDINEATVYRTLSSFEKSGILRRVDLRKDSVCFELNDDHHHHIVCTKCGMIEDFKENIKVEKILDSIIKKSSKFNSIKEHSLELFGFCKACS